MVSLNRLWLFLIFDICDNDLQLVCGAAQGQYLAVAATSSPLELRSLQSEWIIPMSMWGKEALDLGNSMFFGCVNRK